MRPVTFTIDLEDHRPSPTWEVRYPEHLRRLLDLADRHDARATVFVVGELAARSPDLVREVAERGHEIGLHSYRHVPLFDLAPEVFRRDVRRGKALLEDLTGQAVTGFRAPGGTLTPASYWATDVLTEEGFVYSASAVPVKTYVVGFPGCPATPFRWPSGLVELPCPLVWVGGRGLPYLGGTFLRLGPLGFVRFAHRRQRRGVVTWTYVHPYDIDSVDRFWVVPEVRLWGSLLVWTNRHRMLAKLDHLLGAGTTPPLAEIVAGLGEVPIWDPGLARYGVGAVTAAA